MRSCKVEKKNRVEGRPPLCFFAKTLDVPLKSSEPEKRSESSRPRIQPEINKAALERDKWPNRPVTGYDFWPKQPVKHFEAAVCHRDCATRAHAVVGESLVEIVTHLSFQHDVRERFVAHASSNSCHIRVRLREAEIVSEGANLKMILRRGQRDQPACEK